MERTVRYIPVQVGQHPKALCEYNPFIVCPTIARTCDKCWIRKAHLEALK